MSNNSANQIKDIDEEEAPGITLQPELLRLLPAHTSRYTPLQRWNAVLAWTITGNAEAASKICGVDPAMIYWWRQKTSWWPAFYEHALRQQSAEFDAAMTGVINKSISVTMEALDNPKISARDAAVVMAIAYDKRALHRGQATSRVERVDLNKLRNDFAKVIDSESIPKDSEDKDNNTIESIG